MSISQSVNQDALGSSSVVGEGTAGTPTGGVVSVQDVLNGSIQFRAQSVTTTAAEALGAATILAGRKSLVITPTNGNIYWGGSGVTTTSGTPIVAGQTVILSVTSNVHIFVIGLATTDVRIVEL